MPDTDSSDPYLDELTALLASATDTNILQAVVDAPFKDKIHAVQCDLGITVLLIVNKATNNIDRVALSNTDLAQKTLEITPVPFKEIRIPVDDPENSIAAAIKTSEIQKVIDWKYLFTPALNDEASRFNQANAGIGCSLVAPLTDYQDGGAIIFSFYQLPQNITSHHLDFVKNYTAIASAQLLAHGGALRQ